MRRGGEVAGVGWWWWWGVAASVSAEVGMFHVTIFFWEVFGGRRGALAASAAAILVTGAVTAVPIPDFTDNCLPLTFWDRGCQRAVCCLH